MRVDEQLSNRQLNRKKFIEIIFINVSLGLSHEYLMTSRLQVFNRLQAWRHRCLVSQWRVIVMAYRRPRPTITNTPVTSSAGARRLQYTLHARCENLATALLRDEWRSATSHLICTLRPSARIAHQMLCGNYHLPMLFIVTQRIKAFVIAYVHSLYDWVSDGLTAVELNWVELTAVQTRSRSDDTSFQNG